jgi:hypothetical protein
MIVTSIASANRSLVFGAHGCDDRDAMIGSIDHPEESEKKNPREPSFFFLGIQLSSKSSLLLSWSAERKLRHFEVEGTCHIGQAYKHRKHNAI